MHLPFYCHLFFIYFCLKAYEYVLKHKRTHLQLSWYAFPYGKHSYCYATKFNYQSIYLTRKISIRFTKLSYRFKSSQHNSISEHIECNESIECFVIWMRYHYHSICFQNSYNECNIKVFTIISFSKIKPSSWSAYHVNTFFPWTSCDFQFRSLHENKSDTFLDHFIF